MFKSPVHGARRGARVIALLLAGALFPAMVSAGSGYGRASFDCNKARTYGEITVCGSAELADKDAAVARMQARLVAAGYSAGALEQEHRMWMRQQDRCNDEQCVRVGYDRRVITLQQRLLDLPSLDVGVRDPRRAALLDALRATLEPVIGQPLRFKVEQLRERNGFAYARVRALDAQDRPIDYATTLLAEAQREGMMDGDEIHALLTLQQGKWVALEQAIAPTDVAWVDWSRTHGVPAGVIDTVVTEDTEASSRAPEDGTLATTAASDPVDAESDADQDDDSPR